MPSVLESLNTALHQALSDDERVYVLGEDLLDPYGGAFKVTRGLSSSYPGRVLTTPISEAGFIGVGAGMALRGLRPVVEIMFGDFVSLIADQLINHISKFRWMYNDQVRVPIVIRTPMGGRRGYGPTHSQTMEKVFLGVPGLQVIAPAAFSRPDGSESPGNLLYHSILDNDDPVLFIENKLQYLLPVNNQLDLHELILTDDQHSSNASYPTYNLVVRAAPPPVLTLVAYGYMSELARQSMERLAYEHELFTELVIPTRLAPFEIDAVLHSAQRTGALLVVEEGTFSLGWGAELVARVAESNSGQKIQYKRLAAMDVPVPASRSLEEEVLPGVDHIIQAALSFRS